MVWNETIFNISSNVEPILNTNLDRLECRICPEEVLRYQSSLNNLSSSVGWLLLLSLVSFVFLFWLNPVLFKNEAHRVKADQIAVQTAFASLIAFSMIYLRYVILV